LQFQRVISDELGPKYFGCPVECTAPKADPKRGCPDCLYQIKYKQFERDCEAGFKKRSKGPEEGRDYPLNKLIEYMTVVMRANGQTRKGYHPQWSVVMARAVDVYRDELSRLSAIDSWNHKQQMEDLLEKLRSKGKSYDDED
jgi:hypothetical protein